MGLEDRPHAATPDPLEDLILPDPLSHRTFRLLARAGSEHTGHLGPVSNENYTDVVAAPLGICLRYEFIRGALQVPPVDQNNVQDALIRNHIREAIGAEDKHIPVTQSLVHDFEVHIVLCPERL